MKKDAPYPVVYEDHDGSWTWSIEIGEPFEDDHRVLATDQGYPDRKEATSAWQDAMESVANKLQRENEHPASTSVSHAETPAVRTQIEAEPEPAPQEPVTDPDTDSSEIAVTETTSRPSTHAMPSWGVFSETELIALFASSELARAYQVQNPSLIVSKVEPAISVCESPTN